MLFSNWSKDSFLIFGTFHSTIFEKRIRDFCIPWFLGGGGLLACACAALNCWRSLGERLRVAGCNVSHMLDSSLRSSRVEEVR